MVLFLHNRYRTTGGEERVVEDLRWLVRERLGEPAELLQRDSAALGRAAAAAGLLGGGLHPRDVARAVALTGARVVHAHNVHPSLGWRALAAARGAGARVVLHLHQYRLVCAVGVCFTRGAPCTRCHGRNTLPGVLRNCRHSGGGGEALAYGAALALWQRRLVAQADAIVVPSGFAREQLRALGAPLPWERVHVLPPPVRALARERAHPPEMPASASAGEGEGEGEGEGRYALVVSRLAAEKGIEVAIDACRLAARPLVVVGDGPERGALQARAAAPGRPAAASVRFAGRVGERELARLRAGAALALVPSRAPETFGMAAAEAMAAGLPVAASRVGALPELIGEEDGVVEPGDPHALAGAIERRWCDREAGRRGHERVREICAPDAVARRLARIYGETG